MTAEWDAYRSCPDYQVVVTDEPRDRPHSSRELRTGAVSRG